MLDSDEENDFFACSQIENDSKIKEEKNSDQDEVEISSDENSDSEEDIESSQTALFLKIKTKIETESGSQEEKESLKDQKSFLKTISSQNSSHDHWNRDELSSDSESEKVETKVPEEPKGSETSDDEDFIPDLDDVSESAKSPKQNKVQMETSKAKEVEKSSSKKSETEGKSQKKSEKETLKSKRRLSDEEMCQLLFESDESQSPKKQPMAKLDTAEKPVDNKPKGQKKIQMIEPLPQPKRFAKLRGISETTIAKISEGKEHPKSRPNKDEEQEIQRPKFYKAASEIPKKAEVPTKASLESQRKELRKEKLQQLAVNKAKEAEKAGQALEESRQPVKIKQSLPKLARLMTASDDNKTAKKVESKAENKVVSAKKRTFERALSMQDVPKKKAVKRRHSSASGTPLGPSKSPKHSNESKDAEQMDIVNEEAEPLRKVLKKVKWADSDEHRKPLVQIKLIPNENNGRKASEARDVVVGQAKKREEILAAISKQQKEEGKVYTMNDVKGKVLIWNVQWLEEQKKQVQEPPVWSTSTLKMRTDKFANYREYCNVFYPLLMHELWAEVFKEFMQEGANQPFLPVMALHGSELEGPILKLFFITGITQEEKKTFQSLEGFLANVRLRYPDGQGKIQHEQTFGYIERSRMERYHVKHKNVEPLERLRDISKKKFAHVIHLTIALKHIRPNWMVDKPILIKPIARIKPSLRKFQALEDAISFPLFKKLLSPNIRDFFVRAGNEEPKFPKHFFNLNGEQRKIMSACASSCTTNMATPQLTVIQGMFNYYKCCDPN